MFLQRLVHIFTHIMCLFVNRNRGGNHFTYIEISAVIHKLAVIGINCEIDTIATVVKV
jgi:hypothetical protein